MKTEGNLTDPNLLTIKEDFKSFNSNESSSLYQNSSNSGDDDIEN